jgi:hypothetical protein
MTKGTQIVTEFVAALRQVPGVAVNGSGISHNVLEIIGPLCCLLYVKGIGKSPYKWGVTANVVERLRATKQEWHVVLLYESKENGYLLSSSDVMYYISDIWPFGADGDYKPATGTYLSRNSPFKSFSSFRKQLGLSAGV